jgi:hypothetical protein
MGIPFSNLKARLAASGAQARARRRTEAITPSPFAPKDAIGQPGTEQLFCRLQKNFGLAKFPTRLERKRMNELSAQQNDFSRQTGQLRPEDLLEHVHDGVEIIDAETPVHHATTQF